MRLTRRDLGNAVLIIYIRRFLFTHMCIIMKRKMCSSKKEKEKSE